MKETNIQKIRKTIEKELDPKRYEHTLGVAYTAAALAMCHGGDVTKALIAGMLHDCAKCLGNKKKIALCEKHHVEITAVERSNPFLLHAKAGSLIAMKQYKIKDPDILNAIRNHTTGRPGMSLLEKIIYVADYIEPARRQAPNLAEVRRQSFSDLDKALVTILRDTLLYLNGTGGQIDPMTRETYEYYKREASDESESIQGSGQAGHWGAGR